MFDLPTDTKKSRHDYTIFRRHLLEDGFKMMQFSVYARHCGSKENAEAHIERIKRHLPPDGEVRIIAITDKQFERMSVFLGKKRRAVETTPSQMELF